MNDYQAFLQSKRLTTAPAGFTVAPGDINPALFPYQRAIVRWAAARGRAAIFADTGLGKTFMQVEWARLVVAETGGKVLLLSPLAVAHQTIREAAKLGVGVTYVRSQAEADAAPTAIVITNYDMVKALDASTFVGVELKRAYWNHAQRYLADAAFKSAQPTMFDLLEAA